MGGLSGGHPHKTKRRITVLLELTDLSRIEGILGLKQLQIKARQGQTMKGGRKTVTESVDAAVSPLVAPKNRLRGV